MMTPKRLARRGPPSWDTPYYREVVPSPAGGAVPVIISLRHLVGQEQDLRMREVASPRVPPVVHARAGHRRWRPSWRALPRGTSHRRCSCPS